MDCNCKECKSCNVIGVILGIIGIIAVIAGIAYAVYRFCSPEYIEDFDDLDLDPEEEAADEEKDEDIFEEK